jgi:hypothetical protein
MKYICLLILVFSFLNLKAQDAYQTFQDSEDAFDNEDIIAVYKQISI